MLRAAALLGVDFAVTELAIILDRSVADLVRAIDEARAAGVLAESGNGLGFRHPLIRAALYDEIQAPVRAAWHRDAGRALAAAGRTGRPGSPADAPGGSRPRQPGRAKGPVDAELAGGRGGPVGQPSTPDGSGTSREGSCDIPGRIGPARLAGRRLADALYRIGDRTTAEQVASRALEHAADPDLLVDLHWTLAQCRMTQDKSAESLATLDRALASPGISARHRARLLALTARTYSNLGEVERSAQAASSALAAASEASDNWAMGWALLVMALVTSIRGRMGDALPLFDQALDVTQSDPALADLRLLLQINKAITLGCLRPVRGGPDRGRACPGPHQPGRHDDPAGAGARRPSPAVLPDGTLGRRARPK